MLTQLLLALCTTAVYGKALVESVGRVKKGAPEQVHIAQGDMAGKMG